MGLKHVLTLRYVIALLLIAGVMLTCWVLMMQRLQQNEDDGHVLNIAGMQRMYSQRIALMAIQLLDTGDVQYADKLDDALMAMRRNHAELTSPAQRDLMTPTLQRLYDDEQGIDERMRQFTGLASAFLQTYRDGGRQKAFDSDLAPAIVVIARNGFLHQLDAAVAVHEQEFEVSIDDFRRLETVFLGIGLTLLLLEVLLIFRPMVRRVDESLRALNHANRELLEFSFRVSHDLRAPIASSLGLVNIANDADAADDRHGVAFALSRIRHSLQRLDGLVSDIVSISRNRLDTEVCEPVLIGELIDEVLGSLAYTPGFDRLSISIDNSVGKPLVVQRLYLQQIIENLVSNAIKYADPCEPIPVLEIVARQEDSLIVIEVSDNGLGIPAEHRPSVFEMFKRFHTRVSSGSGLGLYLVSQNARALGGRIGYTPLAQGSRFTLRFTS